MIRFMKYTPALFSLFLFSLFSLSMQGQASYTNDASLVEMKRTTAVVRSSGIHAKKKEATQMAIKSAFDTYFFQGIEGLNDGNPLLSEDARIESATYLTRFFDDKNQRYLSFVATYTEDKNPVKLPNKNYKAEVVFEIYTDALSKDLIRSKVRMKTAAEKKVEEIQKEVAQPTIMIVPYKQQGKSYKEVLTDSPYLDYRAAINKVQDAFIEKGYQIKDFIAVLEATEQSLLMESETSIESFDKHLLNNSGTDVYVVVDAGYNTNTEGSMGVIGLQAYERSSGNVLATKQSMTSRYKKGAVADLYRIAIGLVINDFLKEMTLNYAKKAGKGNIIVLRVSVGNESTVDLNTKTNYQSLPLSDALRMWLRGKALNGIFHVQGTTKDIIIFDQIQAPSKSGEGHFLDANDFALDVFDFLNNELNIEAEKRVDGNTIYITVTE
jgi:hypothetical protein